MMSGRAVLIGVVVALAVGMHVEAEETSITVVGDALVVDAPVAACLAATDQVTKWLERSDVVVANFETSLVSPSTPPASTSGGLWLRAREPAAVWLREIGVDVVSMANNHRWDWGLDGAEATWRNLGAIGFGRAGFGPDATSAWAPAVLTASARKVAVIAAACLPPGDPAAARDADSGFPARPGIAVLGIRPVVVLTPAKFAMFTAILREAGIFVDSPDQEIALGSLTVSRGSAPAAAFQFDRADVERLQAAVSDAAANADIVVVSLHCAQGGGPTGQDPPPELRALARELSRDGVDAVAVHGPHHLRGVEWFEGGGVALYGLGSLVLQHRRVQRQPREAFRRWDVEPGFGIEVLLGRVEPDMGPAEELWYGLGASLVFVDGRLERVELTPWDLAAPGGPDECRGLPAPAGGERRQRILNLLAERSRSLAGSLTPSEGGLRLEPDPTPADRGR
jgi:poly-gamma-glutamate capsule biosynthesis protein CapA/YwtB (metallophosphatase superfamily)